MNKACVVCGVGFDGDGRTKCCSAECSHVRRRETQNNYHREYRATRPEYGAKERESLRKYREEHPEYVARGAETIRKHQQEHRDIWREYARKWGANNPDKRLEMNRAYRATPKGQAVDAAKSHNRRVQLNNGPRLTADVILDVKEQFLGYCPYCWEKIVVGEIEHILPVSRGGTHERNNLAWICQTCNGQKSDKTLAEFRVYQETIANI